MTAANELARLVPKMTVAAQHPPPVGAHLAPLEWSDEQLTAIEAIETWLGQCDKPYFYLAGPAGSGKTTLLKHVREVAGDRVLYAAYTGKAAGVMRRKGCTGAVTLDRLIYHHPHVWRCKQGCSAPPCAELCRHAYQEWRPRELNPASPVADADLVIIDEVSMVNTEMAIDLLSFGTPVLVIGDPNQLPPISGGGYFTSRQPDFLLTEIHRQAADNPIITLATMAREGRLPPLGRYGESEVIRAGFFDGDPTEFDIVICGRNNTRRQLNRQIRRRLGFTGPLPMIGEKLLVLRNRHEKELMNGEIVTVIHVGDETRGFLPLTVVCDDRIVTINAPIDLLASDDSDASGAQGDPCCWGYAITGHKSQGSQWDNVLLFDESVYFREHRWRWTYTTITRAAERITVVR